MRAVMRSTSLQPLSCVAQVCATRPCLRKAAIAIEPLLRHGCVRARGSSSQLLSRRLPMPVMQVSSKENSVGLNLRHAGFGSVPGCAGVVAGRSMAFVVALHLHAVDVR